MISLLPPPRQWMADGGGGDSREWKLFKSNKHLALFRLFAAAAPQLLVRTCQELDALHHFGVIIFVMVSPSKLTQIKTFVVNSKYKFSREILCRTPTNSPIKIKPCNGMYSSTISRILYEKVEPPLMMYVYLIQFLLYYRSPPIKFSHNAWRRFASGAERQ